MAFVAFVASGFCVAFVAFVPSGFCGVWLLALVTTTMAKNEGSYI